MPTPTQPHLRTVKASPPRRAAAWAALAQQVRDHGVAYTSETVATREGSLGWFQWAMLKMSQASGKGVGEQEPPVEDLALALWHRHIRPIGSYQLTPFAQQALRQGATRLFDLMWDEMDSRGQTTIIEFMRTHRAWGSPMQRQESDMPVSAQQNGFIVAVHEGRLSTMATMLRLAPGIKDVLDSHHNPAAFHLRHRRTLHKLLQEGLDPLVRSIHGKSLGQVWTERMGDKMELAALLHDWLQSVPPTARVAEAETLLRTHALVLPLPALDKVMLTPGLVADGNSVLVAGEPLGWWALQAIHVRTQVDRLIPSRGIHPGSIRRCLTDGTPHRVLPQLHGRSILFASAFDAALGRDVAWNREVTAAWPCAPEASLPIPEQLGLVQEWGRLHHLDTKATQHLLDTWRDLQMRHNLVALRQWLTEPDGALGDLPLHAPPSHPWHGTFGGLGRMPMEEEPHQRLVARRSQAFHERRQLMGDTPSPTMPAASTWMAFILVDRLREIYRSQYPDLAFTDLGMPRRESMRKEDPEHTVETHFLDACVHAGIQPHPVLRSALAVLDAEGLPKSSYGLSVSVTGTSHARALWYSHLERWQLQWELPASPEPPTMPSRKPRL